MSACQQFLSSGDLNFDELWDESVNRNSACPIPIKNIKEDICLYHQSSNISIGSTPGTSGFPSKPKIWLRSDLFEKGLNIILNL